MRVRVGVRVRVRVRLRVISRLPAPCIPSSAAAAMVALVNHARSAARLMLPGKG